MDWKKIWSGIVEHFLTRILAVVFLSILTAFGATRMAREKGGDLERLSERVTRIMYYLEEVLPDSSKVRAERKMAADKEKWDIP